MRAVSAVCIHEICRRVSGHDGQGQLLGARQPKEVPRRLPGEDQDAEGSPR